MLGGVAGLTENLKVRAFLVVLVPVTVVNLQTAGRATALTMTDGLPYLLSALAGKSVINGVRVPAKK